MAASACILVKRELADRFAVYCGGGVYVHTVSHMGLGLSFVHSGSIDGALAASRAVAIAALHTARRAGMNAWLVRHPSPSAYSL